MRKLLRIGLIAAAAVFVGASAQAGQVPVTGFGGSFNVPVQTLKERQFATVLPQQYDFSCGSAAVASLLTYHYEKPVTEAQAFEAMYIVGDREKIHKFGFSLLDMKKFLGAIGMVADGFEVSLDQLGEVGVPAITLIDLNGYKHFVLVKGVRGDEVLVGDPARGVVVMDRDTFERMWNGIVFVIRDEMKVAQKNFNRDEEWGIRGEAPLEMARLRQGLASFTMNLRSFNEY